MNRRDFVLGSTGLVGSTMRRRPNRTYRVAVIGHTGRGDYGHDLDTAWLDVPDAQVIAVADPDPAGLEKAVARLKGPKPYADFREMLRSERPDLVSIAPRWPDRHREMLLACADAGVKGVLLEKPAASNLEDADAMVAAADRAKMKVAVCHQTRYSPRVAVIKELIRAGRIGDILEVRCRGKEDGRGGGEDLMVLGVHCFDLMRHLAGDPKWCFAQVTEGGRPVRTSDARIGREPIGPVAGDTIAAMYGFASPCMGHFATHRARQGQAARFGTHVYGTQGIVSIGNGFMPTCYLLEDPSWTVFQQSGKWTPISSAGVGAAEPLTDSSLRAGNVLIAKDLIQCIETGGKPLCSLEDGRAAVEMVLAVYASHLSGWPVSLPLRERRHPLGRG